MNDKVSYKIEEIGYKIIEKLNILIKLSALNSIKDMEFKDQAMVLNKMGLRPKEIADILNKNSSNVRAILSYVKRKNKSNGDDSDRNK